MISQSKQTAIASWLITMLATAVVAAGEPLTVMSFNIRYDGQGNRESSEANAWLQKSGQHRRDLVLQVIAEEDPDLLGVQEALPHQVADIANKMSEHDHYAIGRDDGRTGGEHCAIYYRRNRFEKIDAGTFWLCEERDRPGAKFPGAACPRIASWVVLQEKSDAERKFVFLNTHWDHVSQDAREYAATAILAELAKFGEPLPQIVVGDMNASQQSPEIRLMLESDAIPLLDAYRHVHPEEQQNETTFNGFSNQVNGRRIDYVLHSPAWTAQAAKIIRTTFDGRNASDHFPVVAKLEWVE